MKESKLFLNGWMNEKKKKKITEEIRDEIINMNNEWKWRTKKNKFMNNEAEKKN